MRPRRRISSASRTRSVPARSRVTVRRPRANLVRGGRLAAALRASRQALTDLQGQLDEVLAQLRDPGAPVEMSAADRLRHAVARASQAVASIGSD